MLVTPFLSSKIGGAELFLFNLSLYYRTQNFHVHIFDSHGKKDKLTYGGFLRELKKKNKKK